MNKTHEKIQSEFLKREIEHELKGLNKLELLGALCVVYYLRWRADHKIKHVFLAPIGWVLYYSFAQNKEGI